MEDLPFHRPAQTSKRLVLIVEDHEDSRFMLSALLKIKGYDVIEAADGEQALKLTETIRPDLILLDVGLPVLDGLETLRQMRANSLLRDVPVIITSGHAEPAFRHTPRAAGFENLLVKPIDIDELDHLLALYLSC